MYHNELSSLKTTSNVYAVFDITWVVFLSLVLNGQSTYTECGRSLNFSWQRSKHWIWHTLLRWPKFFWRLSNSNYTFLEMVYLMHDNGCRVISLGWKPNKPLPKFPIPFTSHHDIFFFHQHAEVVSCKRKHKRKSWNAVLLWKFQGF